jgi:hypothetical protein
MKLTRSSAAIAALVLAGVTALGIAGPAVAATPGVTYVTASDVAVTPTPGTPGWSVESGSVTSSLSGLSTTAGSHLQYGFSIQQDATTGSALEDVSSDPITFTTNVVGGEFPEFDLFRDGVADLVVISRTTPGNDFADAGAVWESNTAIGSIASNTPSTLVGFDTQLALDPTFSAATIFAVEFFTQNPVTFSDANILGTQFIFTPNPVFTAPTTIAVGDLAAAPGITVTTNGFLPGGSVDVVYDTPGGSSTITTLTADAQGSITVSHVDPTAAVGAYGLRFFGSVPNPQTFAFTVTAAVLAAPGAVLAATGVPATLPLLIASGLLVAGLVLAVIAVRRRSRTS